MEKKEMGKEIFSAYHWFILILISLISVSSIAENEHCRKGESFANKHASTFNSPAQQSPAGGQSSSTFNSPAQQSPADGQSSSTFNSPAQQSPADGQSSSTFNSPAQQSPADGQSSSTFNSPAQQSPADGQSSSAFNSPAQQALLAYAKDLSTIQTLKYIKDMDTALFSLRGKLKNHPIYSKMGTEENVIMFMNTHVFCVWDFVNPVKRLQIYFTSVEVPWRPTRDVNKRMLGRLINEIVLEEETDGLDETFISHFSYYVESIRQVQGGIISSQLSRFVSDISNTSVDYEEIVNSEYLPSAARTFLQSTAQSAMHENILVAAAAFTFGREVMLPEIFTSILEKSGIAKQPRLSMFVNYLDRHIELDGDYHGYLSKKMALSLVSNQTDWDIVIETSNKAPEARLALWDDIYDQLM